MGDGIFTALDEDDRYCWDVKVTSTSSPSYVVTRYRVDVSPLVTNVGAATCIERLDK